VRKDRVSPGKKIRCCEGKEWGVRRNPTDPIVFGVLWVLEDERTRTSASLLVKPRVRVKRR